MTKILLFEILHTDGKFRENSPGLTEYEGIICKLSLKFLQQLQNVEHSDKCFNNQIANESAESKTEPNIPCESDHPKSDDCSISHSPQSAVAERIILEFLKSYSYETQKCCLEIIKDCLLQKQVSALQNTGEFTCESTPLDSMLTSDEVDYLYNVVKSSSAIYEELVAMVMGKELYHECLTEVHVSNCFISV